jgi:hypothetical protein
MYSNHQTWKNMSQETIIKKYCDTHKLVLALQINLSNL